MILNWFRKERKGPSKTEKSAVGTENVSSIESTIRTLEKYRELGGDRLMAHFIEANVLLTIAGIRARTEFFINAPIEGVRRSLGALNRLSPQTRIYFQCEVEATSLAGTFATAIYVFNSRGLEHSTQHPPIPEIPRYKAGGTIKASLGVLAWHRAARKSLRKLFTNDETSDRTDTLIEGFTRGYPWIACLDGASFPRGYGFEEEAEKRGIVRVKIPHAHLYGGAMPEFDVKKEHISHPDVIKTQKLWDDFLAQFYDSNWHNKLRTSSEFLDERNIINQDPDSKYSIARLERQGPLAKDW